MTNENLNQQVYLGYFTSLLPALLLAVTCADVTVQLAIEAFSLEPSATLQSRLSTAIFIGLCLGNPVAVWLRDGSALWMAMRVLAGMAIGAVANDFLLLPLVGDGLLRFALLSLGALGVPILMLSDWVLAVRGRRAADELLVCTVSPKRLARWPARLMFIFVAVATSAGFWVLAPTVDATFYGFFAILAVVTVVIATRKPENGTAEAEVDDDMTALFDAIPGSKDPVRQAEMAEKEMRALFLSFLPGAIFLGAIVALAMRMAIAVSPQLVDLVHFANNPMETTMVTALAGLILLAIGGAVSVGLAWTFLNVFGRFAKWHQSQYASARDRLIRMISMRPMHRN